MTDSEFSKIRIESFNHGKNTRVFLDGVEMKYLYGIKFEVNVQEYNTVTITMLANVELDGEVLTENLIIEEVSE